MEENGYHIDNHGNQYMTKGKSFYIIRFERKDKIKETDIKSS